MNEFFVRLLSSWHAIGPVLVFVAAHAVRPRWGEWPVVAGALAAQFVFDYATSTGREWLAFGTPPWSRLGSWAGCTWWTVRSRRSHLRSPLSMSFIRGRSRWFSRLWRCFALFARERRSRIDHALELGEAYRGTGVPARGCRRGRRRLHGKPQPRRRLARRGHCRSARTRRARTTSTELVALLHDVGKIRVPPEIINKPGPLTTEERAVINQHTILGEQMLDRVGGLLRDVGRLVRSCHEH